MLAAAGIGGADVVELGPGLGRTARDIVALRPRSYIGVDDTAAATAAVREVVEPIEGRVVVADAAATGLPSSSADVVIGEAMLTMQGDKAKRANHRRGVPRPAPGRPLRDPRAGPEAGLDAARDQG